MTFIFKNDCVIDLEAISNWVFKDGDKEYKFNKEEFIKKFCLEEVEGKK